MTKRKSTAEIYRNMSAIRSRDNRTEVSLRRALHAVGLRFRLHPKNVLGKPDIVFPTERVAVFVDGDFWHARAVREQGIQVVRERLAGKNEVYWVQKFERRIVRDDRVNAELTDAGWLVMRFWESDIRKDVSAAVASIATAVRARRNRKSASRQAV